MGTEILLLTDYRRKESLPEARDKNFNLWQKLTNSLNQINLKELFPRELPHEDIIIQKFRERLSKIFNNVVAKKYITGTNHIDISIEDKVAIEIKKIESNTPKDELMGQIAEDVRITDYKYAISYGIDTSKSKKYCILNNLIFGYYRNFRYIIKPFQIENHSPLERQMIDYLSRKIVLKFLLIIFAFQNMKD